MRHPKNIMLIGLEPTLLDFSSPDFAAYPGMNAAKVMAGLNAAVDELNRLGYTVELCLTDFGANAETVVRERLSQRPYDCVLIGAGIRTIASQLILFEKLLNVVHAHAPQARLCFNTVPLDTTEAVQRWL
ncbi:MAG TPA: hypothetical protein DCW29_22650 [Janthinobacterium sp.]|nr:hypothetical protein [Janthinobacterium sp.]